MRTKVVMLRGGVDKHKYHVNLKTGAYVMSQLPEDKYEIIDVVIEKSDTWLSRGIKQKPAELLASADVVVDFSRNHSPKYHPQSICEMLNVPYVSSGVFASSLTRNKAHAKQVAKDVVVQSVSNILLPHHVEVHPDEIHDVVPVAQFIFKKFSPPYIIKPVFGASSNKTFYVESLKALPKKLELALKEGEPVLVEEYVFGKDFSVYLLEGFRKQNLYTLPIVHFKHDEKVLSDTLKHFVPNPTHHEVPTQILTDAQKQNVYEFSKKLHSNAHLRHFSKLDFRLSHTGKIYFLEINPDPAMHQNSGFASALEAVSATVGEVIEHLITQQIGYAQN